MVTFVNYSEYCCLKQKMKTNLNFEIPVGTRAFILSKLYYGVLSKSLEEVEVERYYSILHFISGNEGCTQKQICTALTIDKTAMVKIIDYLVQIGFVERSKNPNDRREHFITLTRKGARQTQEIIEAFKLLDEQLFAGMSEEEKRTFLDVLQRVSQRLSELPANELFFNYTKTDQLKTKTGGQRARKNAVNESENETT